MIQEQQNQQKNAASTGKSCSKGKYNVYFVQGMIGLDTNTVNHLAPELNPPPPPPHPRQLQWPFGHLKGSLYDTDICRSAPKG